MSAIPEGCGRGTDHDCKGIGSKIQGKRKKDDSYYLILGNECIE
jgi:hypothetical protein